MLRRVSEINLNNPEWIRAGIIPFINSEGIIIYAFGIGNIIGDICDFGGHREAIDTDLLDTAIREYEEESLNIFGRLTREMLQDCEVLEGIDTMEILVPITGMPYSYTTDFLNLIGDNTDHEIQNIVWLTKQQLLTIVDAQNTVVDNIKIFYMYDKIYNVIKLNIDLL